MILAGGKGERLGGVVKANLRVGGVRLIDRVAAALADVKGPILVAHGGLDRDLIALPPGAVPTRRAGVTGRLIRTPTARSGIPCGGPSATCPDYRDCLNLV